jgi:hypothetical protein
MAVVALFIPWTLTPWLFLLSGIFFAVGNSVPSRVAWIPTLPAFIFFFGAFLFAGFKPRGLIAAIRCGWLSSKQALGRLLAASACFVFLNLFPYAFSFLAASGQNVHAGQIKLQNVPVSLGRMSLLVAIWILIGVPNQAHRVGLKKDGYAQHILVRVLTAGTCIFTGIYFYSEHLRGGGLRDVPTGLLVAGIVFTAALVAPTCSSIERAIWQRGIVGAFSAFSPKALRESWRKLAAEVLDAFHLSAQQEKSPGGQ